MHHSGRTWQRNENITQIHDCSQFEADRRAFNITINSFGTELTRDVRAKLYPTCGKLYPEGIAKLAECSDITEVQRIAEYYPVRASLVLPVA